MWLIVFGIVVFGVILALYFILFTDVANLFPFFADSMQAFLTQELKRSGKTLIEFYSIEF